MDFIAIDFETANNDRSSVCAVGIALVKNSEVVETIYRLVRPDPLHFDPFNVEIHGISKEQVMSEPEFDTAWRDLQPLFEGTKLVAHFASFDMSVLRYVLDQYEIDYPNLEYACTWVLSKKAWPGLLRYDLATVSRSVGIELEHHYAPSDAEASARIALKACEALKADSLHDLCGKTSTRMGKLFPGGYRPSGVVAKEWNASDITPTTDEFSPEHPCYQKSFVFTGTLMSMPRREAAQKVLNRGGAFTKGITKETNYLVMGVQDISKFQGGQRSKKSIAAEKHLSQGQDIEVISEDDFLKMIEV